MSFQGDQGAPRGGFRGGRGGRGRGRGGGGGMRSGPPGNPFFSAPDGREPSPDPTVTKIEDALQTDGNKLQMLSLEQVFPMRPGYGTKGTRITLWTNYVQISPPQSLDLYRYDITISPKALGKKANQVVRLLLEATELADLREDLVTDFKSTLISRQRLPEDDMEIQVIYRAEGEDEPREKPPQYTVHLKFTNTLSMNKLTEYLTSTNLTSHYNDKFPMMQAFNIFLNHHSKTAGNVASIGASKTFPLSQGSEKWNLDHGLEAIRGFFASVRAATGRMLANVNVSHAAFYKAGSLNDLVAQFMSRHRSNFKLDDFLKKVRVQTTHLKERKNKKGEIIPRIKTITGLATQNDGVGLAYPPRVPAYGAGPKQVMFWMDTQSQGQSSTDKGKGGKKKKKAAAKPNQPGGPSTSSSAGAYISVYDFFANTHGIHLQRPDLPVVNVGTRDSPTYLPPEVCIAVPGQAYNKKLDPAQTQKMIQFAVRKPGENARSIVQQGLQISGLSPQTNVLLRQFNISVSSTLISVPGRTLNEPKIIYPDRATNVRLGGWNMMDNTKFNKAGSLRKWSYLLISLPEYQDAFDSSTLSQTIRSFGRKLATLGINVAAPLVGQSLMINRNADNALLEAKLASAAKSLDLLLVVLPDAKTPLYNQIKHLGDVKYGIQTICTVGHKLAKERGQDQYMANVALKLNLKLGGNNQLVENSRLGIVGEDKTMVLGIDVTHPSPGSSKNAPSVAGMVANVDKSLSQWPGVLRIQPRERQEMVADLDYMLKTRLLLWKSRGGHKEYPENILVYRDGVSEGQYQLVLDQELPLLRKACEEIYPTAAQKRGLPRFTVVVVGKRHHTRFYPTREADADRSSNPKPGTVVDRGVTEARNWDFFLQSHAAIQGTARPAHYFVVIDEIFRQRYKVVPRPYSNVADILEELTQAMCYTFGRATKAVSICTPAYYADILCERARCYLSGLYETPTHSAAPSVADSGQGMVAAHEDVRIHERLRDTMFYI